ncbi:MAG TPA: hypothetical protein VN653_17015, partial [Anaerolineales bacterium]|nr:hypothetical protein [Anaerolineales bacterium]
MNSHRPTLIALELLCFARKAKADTQRCDDATGFSADGRFAVADGVTSCGVASGYFAQFLTDHFTVHSTLTEIDQAIASEEELEAWLCRLAPQWQHFVSGLFGAYSLEWTERAWTKGEPTGCTFAGIRVVQSDPSRRHLNV